MYIYINILLRNVLHLYNIRISAAEIHWSASESIVSVANSRKYFFSESIMNINRYKAIFNKVIWAVKYYY